MEQLRIDILKNEYKGLKGLKIIWYIFSIFFFVLGIIYLIMAMKNNEDWTKYITALTPFILSFFMFQQVRGKGIFSKFVIVNDEAFEWKRFSGTVLYWTNIKSVKFEYTSFIFQMKNGQTKVFPLDNISRDEIQELKERITSKCVRNKIEIVE